MAETNCQAINSQPAWQLDFAPKRHVTSTLPANNCCLMLLELANITKRFGGHPALLNVDLQVEAGEIHGLAGLNGSGKSTLLNILFGSRVISETGGYSGSYVLDGKPCRFRRPSQAVRSGLGMVHQEQALIPDLNVAENIQITREPVSRFSRFLPRMLAPIDTAAMENQASGALEKLGITGYIKQSTGTLSLNFRQFIEIARELSRQDLKLLLLDEPTAVFGSHDVSRLQSALRTMARKGIAIIFVSHRLSEMISICDRVTVLRDGKISARLRGSQLTPAALTGAMVPHDVVKTRKSPANNQSAVKFSVRHFHVEAEGDRLVDLELSVKTSEIFGLTGLSGSGRNSLAKGVMGLCQSSGSLQLDGKTFPISTPGRMLRGGFFFLSEERQKTDLLLNHSIEDNITFSPMHVAGRFMAECCGLHRIFPATKAIAEQARQCTREFSINCRDIRQKVSELSGGNQQKVCMAHALTLAPAVLFINEPTRGVDIAAKEVILAQIINTCRQHGTTVVISSSELDELRRICDRIGVLHQGKLQTILPPETDEAIFASAMMGAWRSE